MTLRRPSVGFTVTLVTAFSLVFAAAMLAAMVGYHRAGAAAALADAEARVAAAAEEVALRMRVALRPVFGQALVPLAASRRAVLALPETEPADGLAALLSAEPTAVTASLVGADGTLTQAIRAAALPPALSRRGAVLALRHVPPQGAGARTGETWRFIDIEGRVSDEVLRGLGSQEPRVEPWYRDAPTNGAWRGGLVTLVPTAEAGFVVSRRDGEGRVLAIGYGVSAIAALLGAARPGAGSLPVLFGAEGALLGHPVPEQVLAAAPLADAAMGAAEANPALSALWQTARARDGAGAPGAARAMIAGGLVAAVAVVDGAVAPALLAGVAVPVDQVTAPVTAAIGEGMLGALAAFLAGIAAIAVLATRIARPLAMLADEAALIRALDLAAPVTVRSRITEVERLAAAMGAMKAQLRQMQAHVPGEVVRRVVAAGEDAPRLAERRTITLLFSDVENFTTLADRLPPETLAEVTSAYFAALTEALQRHGATIDKFIGDSVMALWNAPRPDALHAYWACEGALAARAASEAMAAAAPECGWPPMRTRFGVHTGEAVVGTVGSRERMAYTAMGATVNLASRLEGLNKHYGTAILVSEATRREAGEGLIFRPVDLVLPKGATTPCEVHELLGRAGGGPLAAAPAIAARLPHWREMIARYRAGDLAAAADLLDAAVEPGDPLGAVYRARLAALGRTAPAGWSPVARFETK